jgi:hypothetical protein
MIACEVITMSLPGLPPLEPPVGIPLGGGDDDDEIETDDEAED